MATNDFSSNNQIDHVAISSTNETKTFLSVLELWAIYKNKKQKIYALLDGCATVSSISQNLANNLKVQTTVEKGIEIHGYGNNQTGILKSTFIRFESLNGISFGPDKVLIGPQTILEEVETIPKRILNKTLELGFNPISPSTENSKIKIDVLFGLDWLFNHILSPAEERKFVEIENGFEAYNTKIGTVIHGHTRNSKSFYTSLCQSVHCPVQDIERIFFDNSAPDVENNAEDKKWIESYQNKLRLNEEERRVYAPLPWINEERPKDNFNQIVKLLPALVRKLEKDKLLNNYTEQLDFFVNNNFAEVIDENAKDGFFLNHFPVVRQNTTYDVRPVFNASFKRGSARSLNDFLFKGNLTGLKLTKMLLNWRFNSCILFGDIQKAFLQIKIEPEDRKYLKYLWQKDGKLVILQFTSVIFGATSSPYILESAISKLLREVDPELTECIYMDDILFTANDLEDLFVRFFNVEKALSKGSMKIHKFTAKKEVIEYFRTKNPEIKIEEKDASKILGLLAPFQLKFRSLVRDLHLSKYDWDVSIDIPFIERIETLAKQMEDLVNIRVPRGVWRSSCKDLVLHVFVDASRIAYGACAYVYEDNCGHLLMSKVRLVSETKRTIPQLELAAALEGSRLMAKVLKELPHLKIGNLFSDSMVTLARISSNPKSLGAFESNRIREIQSFGNLHIWKFIPTKINPADCLSRGLSLEKLKMNKLWWNGPTSFSGEVSLDKAVVLANVRRSSSEISIETNIFERICNLKFKKALLVIERLLAWMSSRFGY
ncbi:uncharacterized protein LOC113795621 [Dermatophagoides pteronyssinus]|uniref:uncharacterized protein LOC113795621 n=1 Tax=Dermatophagoides pteronyssinus TaxID=6956 RepID=UPI003F660FB5